MHTLVVVAHPTPGSLTHSLAKSIVGTLSSSKTKHTVDLLDLYAENFNPLFSDRDMATYRKEAEPPADVIAQQKRIEAAQSLVLVFPIHWWGMPAVLKGWVDRVFTNGWAFDWSPETGAQKKLKGLEVHVLCIGGASSGTYVRHGYEASIKKIIGEGLFDYTGASVGSFHVVGDSESPEKNADIMEKAGTLSRLILDQS
ncbi:NAD(P)H-dependent oxidoreductase [Cupriavidus necator]|uniref:NAD(P)H dehydrogenase (Quinone) n=1 Tax=Cupriavidus pinatubonensis (strain JMP 134 / LMG 1197) TaxID=264198 RepID=Q46MN7_CUPPJ|nr:NAD(P)H-dependent oxidoreductase [Cupriavidus necator]